MYIFQVHLIGKVSFHLSVVCFIILEEKSLNEMLCQSPSSVMEIYQKLKGENLQPRTRLDEPHLRGNVL